MFYIAMIAGGEVQVHEREIVPPAMTMMAEETPADAVANLIARIQFKSRELANRLNSLSNERRIALRWQKRHADEEILSCTSAA